MPEERIDIVVSSKVDAKISKNLKSIGVAADQSDKFIKQLASSLKNLPIGPVSKLAQEMTKATNARAREINGQARLIAVKQRQQIIDQKILTGTIRLKIANDKLKISNDRVAISSNKVIASQIRKNAVELRAVATANRLALAQNRVATSSRNVASAGISLRGVLSSLVVLYGVRAVIRLSDEYTELTNRLRIVTTSAAQLATVQRKVFEIAQRSRAPVKEVATAFQRFDLALVQLGASQKEVLAFTETVTKAVQISGLTSGEAANGVRQFSQAMNKGKLDGEEFRSVMENVPILADAIAKEMGVARGELLNLAPQGKITGVILRKSIAGAAVEIEAAFAKLNPTIAQSMTVLSNSAILVLEQFNQATGASKFLARALLTVATNFETIAKIVGVLVAGAALPTLVFLLKAVSLALTAIAVKVGVILSPFILLGSAIAAIIAGLVIFRNDIKLTQDGVVSLGDVISVAFDEAKIIALSALEAIGLGWVTNAKAVKLAVRGVKGAIRDLYSDLISITRTNIRILTALYAAFTQGIAGEFRVLGRKIVGFLTKDIKAILIIAQALGADFSKELAKLAELSGEGGKSVGESFVGAFNAAFKLDPTNKALDELIKKFRKAAGERRKLEDELRGGDPDQTGGLRSGVKVSTLGTGLVTVPGIQNSPTERAEENLAEARDAVSKFEQEIQGKLASIDKQQATQLLKYGKSNAELEVKRTKLLRQQTEARSKLRQAELDDTLNKAKSAVSSSESTFSDLAKLAANAEGADSKRAKRLFKISKAFGIAKATVNMAQGISEGVKLGFPLMIPAIAAAAASGALQIQTIQAQNFATGGFVRGRGGPTDDLVRANLSNGEFVVRAAAVENNRGLLEAINSGRSISDFTPQAPSSQPSFSRSSGTSRGSNKDVTVNVFTISGTTADVQTTEENNQTRIDIIIRQVDEKLASNLSRNTGALTKQVKALTTRGF